MRTLVIVTAHLAVSAAFRCASFQFTSIKRLYRSLTFVETLVELGMVAVSHRDCVVSFLVQVEALE